MNACQKVVEQPVATPSRWPRVQRNVKCWFERWSRMRASRYQYVIAVLEQTPLPPAPWSRRRPHCKGGRDE